MSKQRQPSVDRQFVRGGATATILSILDESPMHGYELIQTIRERTQGLFDFSDGTVYPLLYYLRDKGWIRDEVQTSEEGRTRKVYRLTPAGRAALRRQTEDWLRFSRAMTLALGRSR
ncbi:MAG TPA: helix-turn-helix transcriptional regulator [Vicinamibacterales bacterium]|nr:helix-turn-helix transcriptional regulator [Vicinamibacterales bacterium]